MARVLEMSRDPHVVSALKEKLARLKGERDKVHSDIADDFSYYRHKTPEIEIEARQYPNRMWPLFVEFIDTVWIPQHSEKYFSSRDPAALPYLPKLLAPPQRPLKRIVKAPVAIRSGSL
jgi:hypothetical protein